MALPYVISGHCYQSDGSTPVANIVITIKNATTGESHSGGEANFSDLTTNSLGEFSGNLGSFNFYSNNDSIEISAYSSVYGSDIETTTVDTSVGSETDIKLALASNAVRLFNEGLNKLGERADYRVITSTYEDDYGSIESESAADTTLTMKLDIITDEKELMEHGEMQKGEAIGFFKAKDNVAKGNLIRIPRTTGRWWKIQDKPRRFRYGGQAHHDEARMILI